MTADKDYVLFPGPRVWLVAPVSAVQLIRDTEASKPSSPVSPHISGVMHLMEHRPSCAAKGCGSSHCCSLHTKQGAVASMGCSPTRQRLACRVHKPPRTGSYTQPNVFFSLMRKTLLFSHQNTWFWLIFTGSAWPVSAIFSVVNWNYWAAPSSGRLGFTPVGMVLTCLPWTASVQPCSRQTELSCTVRSQGPFNSFPAQATLN